MFSVRATYATVTQYLSEHPYARGLVLAAETSAAGAITDYLVNRQLDLSPTGLKKLAAYVLLATAAGIRYWLVHSPLAKTASPTPASAPQADAAAAGGSQ